MDREGPQNPLAKQQLSGRRICAIIPCAFAWRGDEERRVGVGLDLELRKIAMIIRKEAFARIGFLGNPSDGYFGKTIACCIRDFSAKVTLWESPKLHIVPNASHDPTEFSSMDELSIVAKRDGYYGGIRLLFATCKKFQEWAESSGMQLSDRNFTVAYDTTIPRQVGLGGSSAIITAGFKALMEFYEVTEKELPLAQQANWVLSVERDELGIAAGLQDRVVQCYGGSVYMDFNKELMESRGYGAYERLEASLFPPLFLAFDDGGKESGLVHGDLRFRYNRGDSEVLEAIQHWAGIAQEGKEALHRRDFKRIGELMRENFRWRRKILGDEVLGSRSLEMIEIAQRLGFPAKFPGSGGAVIGMYRERGDLETLRQAYEAEGFSFVAVELA